MTNSNKKPVKKPPDAHIYQLSPMKSIIFEDLDVRKTHLVLPNIEKTEMSKISPKKSPKEVRKFRREKIAKELSNCYEDTKIFNKSRELTEEIRQNIKRSGVIPYCVKYYNNNPIDPLVDDFNTSDSIPEPIIYFGMAIDKASGELTDCGGHIGEKEVLEFGAARELYEESLGIFDIRKNYKEVLSNSVCVVNRDVCIFFVNITLISPHIMPKTELSHFFSEDPLAITFQKSYNSLMDRIKNSNPNLPSKKKIKSLMENSLMYWISSSELKNIVNIRTRCVAKKGYHPSKVKCSSISSSKIIYEQLKSKIEESKRSKDPISYENMNHPLMYETVRRIIFPSIDKVIETII